MIQKCDVLIIGAGPAGASLALYLAEEGIGAILIDKKAEIDNPVRCAEYVPAAISRLFDGSISGISCSVANMDTYIDYGYANTISSPGFMLDRPVFMKSLINNFTENGGRFLPGTRAVFFDELQGVCSKQDIQQKGWQNNDSGMVSTTIQGPNGKRSAVKSKIVVGADGPNSIVGKYIGSTNSNYFPGLGENIPVEAKDKKRTLIFFSPGIKGGYGWLFPKKDSINLGIGCQIPGKKLDLKALYNSFKRKVVSMGLLKSTGDLIPAGEMAAGLIPSSGILKRIVSGSFILAGDAAGLTNPITGAGIYNAVFSAKIISGIIRRTLEAGDPGLLAMIEEEYKNTFGISLGRAVKKRKILISEWKSAVGSGDKKSFEKLIKQCWVSFKPYWKK